MSTSSVAQYLYLMDAAFEGIQWHSLLGNLRTVTQEDWDWLPAGGHRSIQHLVGHVGACKLMYHNHAFGDARLAWDDPLLWSCPDGRDALTTVTDAIEWLREGQRQLRQSVAALDDDELLRPRKTNWGALEETRWIITVMIQHDLYHAGEINHLRALHQQNDR